MYLTTISFASVQQNLSSSTSRISSDNFPMSAVSFLFLLSASLHPSICVSNLYISMVEKSLLFRFFKPHPFRFGVADFHPLRFGCHPARYIQLGFSMVFSVCWNGKHLLHWVSVAAHRRDQIHVPIWVFLNKLKCNIQAFRFSYLLLSVCYSRNDGICAFHPCQHPRIISMYSNAYFNLPPPFSTILLRVVLVSGSFSTRLCIIFFASSFSTSAIPFAIRTDDGSYI